MERLQLQQRAVEKVSQLLIRLPSQNCETFSKVNRTEQHLGNPSISFITAGDEDEVDFPDPICGPVKLDLRHDLHSGSLQTPSPSFPGPAGPTAPVLMQRDRRRPCFLAAFPACQKVRPFPRPLPPALSLCGLPPRVSRAHNRQTTTLELLQGLRRSKWVGGWGAWGGEGRDGCLR
ncbi:unnamed protein product [Gadus morhua 'NCC']